MIETDLLQFNREASLIYVGHYLLFTLFIKDNLAIIVLIDYLFIIFFRFF